MTMTDKDTGELLSRVDERTKNTTIEVAGIKEDIRELKNTMKTDIDSIKTILKENYVQKTEFAPVKSIAYGLVAVILVAFITALVTIVIQPNKTTQQQQNQPNQQLERH